MWGHIPELIEPGITGALIGSGKAGTPTDGDNKKDGVTNPPVICTRDGISAGQMCNDHLSTVVDDDGGFVRMMGQAYYQNPVALNGAAASEAVPPPVPAPAPAAPAPPSPGADLRV